MVPDVMSLINLSTSCSLSLLLSPSVARRRQEYDTVCEPTPLRKPAVPPPCLYLKLLLKQQLLLKLKLVVLLLPLALVCTTWLASTPCKCFCCFPCPLNGTPPTQPNEVEADAILCPVFLLFPLATTVKTHALGFKLIHTTAPARHAKQGRAKESKGDTHNHKRRALLLLLLLLLLSSSKTDKEMALRALRATSVKREKERERKREKKRERERTLRCVAFRST